MTGYTAGPSSRRPTQALGVVTAVVLATTLGVLAALVHPMGAVVVPLVALALALVFSSAFALLLVFTAMLYLRPADYFPELASLPLADLAVVGALSALVLGKLLRRDFSWARSPANRWFALLTLGILLSSAFSTDSAASFAFFETTFAKAVVIWLLLLNLVDTRWRTFVLQATVSLMTGILGAHTIWARKTEAHLIEETRAVFVGLLADPNDLAFALLLGLPFAVEAFRFLRNPSRWLFLALAVLTVGGILATQSRGGLFGLAICAYFWFRTYGVPRGLAVPLTVGGAVLGIVFGGIAERRTVSPDLLAMDTSAQGRLDAWYAGARMLRHNPVFGVGFNQAAANFGHYGVDPVSWRPKTSHNMFVQAGAETGLVGFIPFLLLIGHALRASVRLRAQLHDDSPPWARACVRAQLPNLLSLIVAGFFLSVAWSWFLFIGLALVVASERNWLSGESPRER
jgi:putative inorganic carbon (hco3(-)) transporter